MKNLQGTPAEGRVSYADLIALGGAYAVPGHGAALPSMSPIGAGAALACHNTIPCRAADARPGCILQAACAGRRDSATPDPTDRLPEETLSAEALRLNFAAKGMSARELVALSGAPHGARLPCLAFIS